MFYSNQILARKGPLGLVWIAAHLDRQLKRQQINNTSIPASVDTLLDSEVPLALRLSGQLLLGVVRIYARKVNYLQQDCNDALVKIRVALRPADGVNLPPGSQTAPVESITLFGPKQHASKGNRAGGRKAAAGAADAPHGGAGGVGVDGFDIDVDEYWEQDVLLGRDGGLAGFELGAGFDLGLSAPSGSGPMSQDISGVFGMHSSQDYQEVFDVEDAEAAAAWDLDDLEVERLRAVASSQHQHSSGVSGLLGLGGTPGVDGPDKAAGPAAGSQEGSDVDDLQLQPPPDLPDIMAPPPAAERMPADGHTPLSKMAMPGAFADGDLADLLPPTPAGAVDGTQDSGMAGTAGGTGGAAAGYTPGTIGGRSADLQALLPPTPDLSAGIEAATAAAGAAGDGAGEDVDADMHQWDHMELDQADADGKEEQEEQQPQAGGGTRTFQRRTRQQQQQQQQDQAPAAADGSVQGQDAAEAEAVAAVAAAKAKAAKQKRSASSQLLGQKRRMVIDDYPDDAPATAAGGASKRNGCAAAAAAAARRQPPTELPASEIRALLADRTPLLDITRLQSQGKHLRLEAALAGAGMAGSLSLSLAAPAAGDELHGRLQLQQALTTAGAGRRTTASSNTGALATLLRAPSSSCAPAGGCKSVLGGSLLGLGGALVDGLGVIGGLGLRLAPELQELFVQAATAGAAAAPGGGAAAVAQVAAPDEIEMAGDDDDGLNATGAGATRLSAGGGVTRSSLSLASTPGSAAVNGAAAAAGAEVDGAAGVAGGTEQTPATAAGAAADVTGDFVGTAGFSSGGFGSAGFGSGGFTPGSVAAAGTAAGAVAGSVGDDLQPPVAAGASLGGGQELVTTAGMLEDDFHLELHQEDERELGSDVENPAPASVGKTAAAAAAVMAGRGVGLVGSSARSTQEGALPWPADAEMLQEQDEEGGHQPGDGGFTSRTRLVMRHLQHTAAAAAGGAAAGTPSSAGGRRRISALPPPALAAAAAAAGENKGIGAGSAAAAALSFNSLTHGHSRLDACRWFYEVLVLSNKGLVGMEQEEAYGDIVISPNLAAMASI